MAARVTVSQVKEIITTSIEDAVITSNFIDTANLFVDEHLLGELSEAMLAKIELYLAAHFVALTEEGGGVVRTSFGDSADSYANIYEAGFQSTRYGQQALALDTTGTLTRISKPTMKAEFRVV